MALAGGVMMLLMIGAFGLLFRVITDLGDAGAVARRSEAVLAAANRLEKLVVDLETNSRAFVLTEEQRFLRSYDTARAGLPGQAANLERISAEDNADQVRRARQIAQAGDSYTRDYLAPLMNTGRNNPAAARSRVLSGEGLWRLASVRDQLTAFEDAQREMAAVREQHSIGAARKASITAAGSTVGALSLIWLFVAYLTGAIVRPVRRASLMAGELAEGDLAVRMPETSPGEIGVLESKFNTMASSLETSRSKLCQLAAEQGALRRVATLVARGVSPSELFAAVAAEVGRVLRADHTNIIRYDADETATVVGYWNDPGVPKVMPPLDGHWPVESGTVTAAVLTTERPARMRDYERATSAIGIWARSQGIRYVVGCPVKVERRVWGAMIMHSLETEPQPGVTEDRMLEFVELVGTAIANAQSRSDLLASRARVVAAADESRRRIERNLHDGAQQQLVALALKLRATEAAVAPCQDWLREQLSSTVHDLSSVLQDLQEISRGLVPTILTRNGLQFALGSLARRSPVPVELDLHVDGRLPEPVEVAIYYTVSEALTNTVKYAHASAVEIDLTAKEAAVWLSIHDDGIGGANRGGGSGLIGLKDRVEALGGRLTVTSLAGGGTSLLVDIPIEHG